MDTKTSRIISCIVLNRYFGYSPKVSHEIINCLGGAEKLLELNDKELQDLRAPFGRDLRQLSRQSIDDAAQEYERLRHAACDFICYEDDGYPILLRECEDAPVLLYCRSTTPAAEIFGKSPAIAIVGTRDISSYGKEWCTRIVRGLAEAKIKPLIISGLALGVDICAHLAALGMELPTVGVMPVGIERVYPASHTVAAQKIVSSPNCALVTDYTPDMGAMTCNFVRRNRIIAGLCGATILIESKVKGGGMMTARLAHGYGREVYALPGRIDDLRSGGCNQLLWEKLAEPIYNIETLIESLGLEPAAKKHREDIMSVVKAKYCRRGSELRLLNNDDGSLIVKVFTMIKERKELEISEICELCGLGYAQVSRIVGILESDGYICTDLLQRCTVVY